MHIVCVMYSYAYACMIMLSDVVIIYLFQDAFTNEKLLVNCTDHVFVIY